MKYKLHYNTVTPLLKSILEKLMGAKEFNQFRLVGGTALSLYYGHRMSVDIDLFTEAEYGTIDFQDIEDYLVKQFTYVDFNNLPVGMGKSYFIGNDSQNAIKLDLYYTEPFIDDVIEVDAIRMATIEEIIAMKIDVIQRTGRKKDYWDLHELKDQYNIKDMLGFHLKRYPHTHNAKQILNNFVDFEEANDDFDPVCLRDKYWEFIKLDLIDFVNN
ncbi:MAG: nucleotidyl transferase AbiEii/AbiGii toxin family protein [Bacteroidia bacterium]|nr:nucleotidyl transferase AbiEii/AbiGii toxin family protein [Bacteroidia bacterium]